MIHPEFHRDDALKRAAGAAGPSAVRRRYQQSPKGYQEGTIAVMAVGCLVLMLAMCAVALDIGQVFNRKMELQAVADAAALAAARQLDGTPQGLASERERARAVVEEGRRTLAVKYNSAKVVWSDAALTFSASHGPGAEWSSGGATGDVGSLFYARVQTEQLGRGYGSVQTLFIHVLAPELREIGVVATAVAGRSSINVTPLAVCAMSDLPAEPRNNPANGSTPANVELVEFGFRRGVAYDLMQLNPGGTSPVHYILDPEAAPGQAGKAANVVASAAAPYVCSGTMAVPNLRGGEVSVFPSFPLAELHAAFNSRFGDYTGNLCNVNGAPPDANVRQYTYTAIGWMSTSRSSQAAQSYSEGGKLQTVADPLTPPVGATAEAYGPLWAYGRAVPFSAYSAGTPEPLGGYTPFPATAWPALYGPGKPVASGYPSGSSTPYAASGGGTFLAPIVDYRPGVRDRRVLNIPLLVCPVIGSRAKVAGIGRFFMTVPATSTALIGEFAGTAPPTVVGGQVELYR